ncbi:manganese/iron ABC transporter ATP-binding protein [Psychromonas sp. 14N.309.X.WAT.B.A12]|jgi:manganese/iron transport system ATP-binding protein|uniref:manganese/iron ABC transporter ATP-binding protein n=1 Tax=Psychromonas sp. 14N.309.X.WAT.B.A12 TaxID=2998322 RepID=UPI0025AFA7BF|nr:manganese/iron ABC transporter ATP-binding protein [Psychromonas sp. 14N.309.X.WAT.B.A12]MDN2664767.1 manganese/iron ABC transporter ATP-binding protein [Psychromonas sp. 14N.309.X.WAT.B.A12]
MLNKQTTANNIKVNDITVTYRNGFTAIHDASFTLPKGSITALVGINGSGKSTIFKSIMGLVNLKTGSVNILGLSVKQALKSNIVAYVPQSEEIDWDFPILVEDVVMMGRYGHMNMLRMSSAKDREMVDQALRRVNMQDYRHRQIGELSGGQKKRIFLARALAQESQVILLDEPFTGVDVKTEEHIMQLLKVLREEGKVILVSTHNLGSIPEFCDRTVFVNRTVLDEGPTEKVFTPDNIQKAFGGALRHFVLSGDLLHTDDDKRQVTVISDDERPVVLYGEQHTNTVLNQL